ncbi:MAG: hypothetical protein GEU78_00310 [Actinobacteria bacterium]|nr:hypothetical protein [Actinomycetota bacterium]
MDGVEPSGVRRLMLTYLFLAQSPSPSPSPLEPIVDPSSDPIGQIVAIVSIALAVAAAVIGYRIIRGGRGL